MKKVHIITTFVVAIILTILSILSWYRGSLKSVNVDNATFSEFEVETGESTASILERLEDQNLIKSQLAAKVYLKLNPQIIQAGKYTLGQSMTTKDILNILSNAEDETVWITIPEGLRIDEIAEIWAEKVDGISKSEFEQLANSAYKGKDTAEGYLFPDTYNVDKEIATEEAFELMTTTFEQKVGTIDYDALILASIVEREGRTSDERPVVAGILQKRLNTPGWLLQADATLLYDQKDWKATITKEIKDTYSPYNTYQIDGLPPTPICNPGLESINAARDPETTTPYWYYLHDKDGIIHYAVTQEEHDANIYNYLY